jgi:TonB-linked SusC/RagA family outer membrane protein
MKKKWIRDAIHYGVKTKTWKIMRLSAFFLFLFLSQVWAESGYSQQTKLTLKMENARVVDVLDEIENNSEFYFLFNQKLVDVERKVNVDAKEKTIDLILTEMFAETDVHHQVNDRLIILTTEKSGFNSESILQQQKSVTGKITDESGQTLPGVAVVIKGTTNGTVSDIDGNFSIANIPDDATLVFSFVGMRTQEIAVNGATAFNVIMKVDAIGIDEVIAVGYGTQKKVNVTGSVQSISSEALLKRNVPNASSALQGLAAGVSVVQTSGSPGADGTVITIRGKGSLNSSSSPLVLIDGVEGNMDKIDMNTIESISVLKDAASASIYGSKASNGVILVTTKRAKAGDVKISYSGFVGTNTATELPVPVSALGYMEQVNIAKVNSNQAPQYSQETIDQFKASGPDNMTTFDTDWKNLVMKDNALTHNHSVSLSGGSDKVRFFANGGYFYQDGMIANNDYNRKTLRINTDADVTKWMKVGVDVNVGQSNTMRPIESSESLINKAITFVPVFSGLNDDGTFGYGQNGDNPYATATAGGTFNTVVPQLGVKGFVEINPVKGWVTTASYSSNSVETREDYFRKPYDTFEGGVFKVTNPTSGAEKSESFSRLISNQFNFQSYFEKTVDGNYFKALGGIQTEERLGHSMYAMRKGYYYDGFEELDHGDITTVSNGGTSYEYAMLSFFGRINYNYKERYLLELNGRWDKSSRFMKDYQLGFFPSASVGWRISEEAFFEPLKNVIGNLKVRGSYGTLGNQDLRGDYYPYAATLSSGYGYWFDKVQGTGVAQTSSANEKISWETSTQMDIGLDASMFSNKLGITFDYYTRNINDMLQQFPVPYFVGLGSPWENAGSMENKGWDLSLSWNDQIGKVKYHVTGYLSDVKNTVTNLYGKEYITDRIVTEGESINSWYGYVAEGFFQTQEEIDASPVYGNKATVTPGYVKYKDITGPDGVPDGIINSLDRTIIGDFTPRYEYSFDIGAEWNNFDFSLFLQGVGKKDIYYGGNGARPFYIGRTIFESQLDYWSPENTNAEFPILLIDGTGTNPNNLPSTQWVKSGAYMRVKNVVLGYTLPKTMLMNYKLDNLRVYVSGQNLLTFSNAYAGYDPEQSVNNGSFYPLNRTLTFGLDIRF